MRFHHPLWLSHHSEKKDFEAYSCHVSPDGTRLATAGGDGHVRIWSTESILSTSPHPTGPKQLASLSYHSGTVHSVRFSPNGKYLASGADDKIVCIYNLDSSPPAHTTFGSKEEQPVENWRIFRRLIGHDNDVQDLGWSYDSSILVSVGLDSKVVVWSGSTFEKLKTLSQHQSHVKGITFDPANKYFATASDDRTLRIYRFTSPAPNASAHDSTNNFTLEKTVSAPFEGSPLTTYFRRCSWSPEGQHIAAANAVNGPVSTVAIVNRGTWDSDISLVGHEGPIEVCAFAPRLFCNTPPPPMTADPKDYVSPPTTSIVACAGQDRILSVWNTTFSRPFITTSEMCAKSITDLAWAPDSETIFFTSLDGTIAALVFERGELGFPALRMSSENALAKYGAGRKGNLVEGADALRLEEGSRKEEVRGVEGRMGELMGDTAMVNGHRNANGTHTEAGAVAATTNGVTTNGVSKETTPVPLPAPAAATKEKDPQAERADQIKQRVTFTKEGKKRIAPLLVSSSNIGESNLPRAQLQSASSARGGPNDLEPAGGIVDLSKPYDGLPKGGLASLLLGNKRKYAEMDGDEPGEKRSEKRVQAVQASGSVPIVHNTVDGLVPATRSEKGKGKEDVPEVLRPAIVDPTLTVSQVRLAVPMVRSVILRPLDPAKAAEEMPNGGMQVDGQDNSTDSSSSWSIVFEARNASGPSRTGRVQDREPTRITVTRRSQVLWQDFLPKAVLLVTGNRNFWAAACEDGSLYVWTPAGRRLLNAMVLESQTVILDCRGWFLLALTAVGKAYVWDLRIQKALHQAGGVSLAPVLDVASHTMGHGGHLTAGAALMFARLNSNGRIVVGMSNGEGFAYNSDMGVWQRLSEGWWAVGSQYWNTLADTSSTRSISNGAGKKHGADDAFLDGVNPENVSAGILPLLERHTTTHALLKGRAFFLQRLVKALLSAEGYEGFESTVSIAHLENRLAAAYSLGARDEWRVYLGMYARRIGAEGAGYRGKVEELLRGLTGRLLDEEQDAEDGGTSQEWGDKDDILGWKRQDLLKEVVMVLGKQRELQRATVPYARFLGVLEGGDEEEEGVRMLTE